MFPGWMVGGLFLEMLGVAPAATLADEEREESAMKLTEPLTLYLPYDLQGKSVEYWAHAENAVDWEAREESLKNLCTVAYAAVELKTACEKMSPGRKVSLTGPPTPFQGGVLVGERQGIAQVLRQPPQPDRPESYVIDVTAEGNGGLVLCGFDRAGTLYGVYEFLDRLGCRWFGPEPWQEVIPGRQALTVSGLPWVGAPRFTMARGFLSEARGRPELFVWMARNRMNLWFYDPDHYPLQRKLCLLIQGGGHTWEQLLHPDLQDADGRRLFEVHPEWFAEIDGQRNPGGYHPCVSNEQAVDYLIDRFIEQIQTEFRHCDLINYWPYDTWQEWCQCERCQALGNGTDRYIFVAAQTHRRLREAHAQGVIPHIPRVILCAYEGTKTTVPPTKPLPPSFDTDLSAFIFFPINRCYAHSIDDPTCTEINAPYRQEFEGWAESPYAGPIVIGEYYNVSKFEDLPLLFYRTMPHDMAYYCAHRARGFNYMHATAGQWGTKTLTNWEMARLCWDVQEDPAQLLERFFREYFGPVAAEMRAVFALIEAAFTNVAAWRNWAGTSVTSVMRQVPQDSRIQSVFPLRHLQFDRRATGNDSAPSALEGLRNIDQAREQIDGVLAQEMPEEVRQRVAEVEFLFRYGELSYRLYCSLAQVVSLERGGETDAARAEFLKADRIARELAEINFQYAYCSPPGNRFNALVKTQVDNVVEHYRKLFNLKS